MALQHEGSGPRAALAVARRRAALPVTLAALVWLGLAAPALGQDREALEDELFGGPAPVEAQAPGQGDARDEAIFGQPEARADSGPSADERLAEKMAQREDALEIGGRLFLQLNAFVFDQVDYADTPLLSPNLLDVYLDARPDDRVRAYFRGRLTHNLTLEPEQAALFANQFAVDQLWIKFDIARAVFITAGRQPVRWGVGRIWNPTDFLNLRVRDPLAVADFRLGTGMVKVHVPFESLGWNLIGAVVFDGADTVGEVSGALRLEMLAGPAEFTVSVAEGRDEPLRLGADASMGVGPFDLRLEGAVLHGVETGFYRGRLALDPNDFALPTPVDRSDEYIAQGVAGAEVELAYGERDSLILGVEYFYNEAGYDSSDIYLQLLRDGLFNPLYLGRHYAAIYTLLPSPGSWEDTTILFNVLGNISDLTVLPRLDVRQRALTWLDVNVFVQGHIGDTGGEFRLGINVPPRPGLVDWQRGFFLPTPEFDVGVSLSANL